MEVHKKVLNFWRTGAKTLPEEDSTALVSTIFGIFRTLEENSSTDRSVECREAARTSYKASYNSGRKLMY